MKGLLFFPLAVALLVGTAHSLRCYTCLRPSTNAACNTETNCPSRSEYCLKVQESVSGMVSKVCSPDCQEGLVHGPGLSGTSATISYTLLSLAAVISALVVKAAL
ncbi:lymphocyte antigen 6E-like [Lissotriton helveticus]